MPVSVSRQIAYDILIRVDAQGAYASDLLHDVLSRKIKSTDAALATEITMGVLRNEALLDFLIERYSRKRIAALDREVVTALRMGIYQMRFLERVPTRAAVNESVEIVKHGGKRSAVPFVNAVLRRAGDSAREAIDKMLPPTLSPVDRLAILYSHPAWLVERWIAQLGEARAIALLEFNTHAPELIVAAAGTADLQDIRAALSETGADVKPGRWVRSAFAVRGGSPANSAAFRDGRISIQDEASQMAPLLLGTQRGDSVLDVCAAPGGKTAILARAAGPDALVVATDWHPHRLRAMKSQLDRLLLANVRLVELDATQPLPFRQKFRRILVDAPCSGTGTLARHPEIRWRLQPNDLAILHGRQVSLLRAALEALEDGGRLVYSTCSLEREENEEVVAELLASTPNMRTGATGMERVTRDEMIRTLAPHLVEGADPSALIDDSGAFRTFPPEHRTDGFFAAAFQKRAK